MAKWPKDRTQNYSIKKFVLYFTPQNRFFGAFLIFFLVGGTIAHFPQLLFGVLGHATPQFTQRLLHQLARQRGLGGHFARFLLSTFFPLALHLVPLSFFLSF